MAPPLLSTGAHGVSMVAMRTTQFSKGQGTGNDFVILLDRPGMLNLTPAHVKWLCDRRFGVGGDGLLRATRASNIPEWDGRPDMWFMDFRNADGSIAEMCGNGLRVFAEFLREEGLITGNEVDIATRVGVKHVLVHGDGTITADLGRAAVSDEPVTVTLDGRSWQATPVDVGNPHAVVLLGADDDLDELPVQTQPSWEPRSAFPDGVNIEFVEMIEPGHVRMRVHERGVGETLSCGTGTVAVAAAMTAATGHHGPWTVDVPGGRIVVEESDDGFRLIGPAVIQIHGEVICPDLG